MYTVASDRCEQVCGAENATACAGFTWYPDATTPIKNSEAVGSCCFRSDTSSKPLKPGSDAICYEKKVSFLIAQMSHLAFPDKHLSLTHTHTNTHSLTRTHTHTHKLARMILTSLEAGRAASKPRQAFRSRRRPTSSCENVYGVPASDPTEVAL